MKPSKHDAKLVCILSIFCFIPFINLFASPIICFMSVRALQKIRTYPKQFGGKKYALFAFWISTIIMIFSYSTLILNQLLTT